MSKDDEAEPVDETEALDSKRDWSRENEVEGPKVAALVVGDDDPDSLRGLR